MSSKKILVGALVVALCLAGGFAYWYYAQPHTAAEQLAHAREFEAKAAPKIQTLKSSSAPEDSRKAAELLGATLREYAKVSDKYTSSPEAEEADYRVLQICDENSSGPEARLGLCEEFLKRHPGSAHAADVRWQAATITHKDLKKYLDAVKLYKNFAQDFPKDDRAAEALFRIGNIYEEIKEFPQAVAAYKRVVAEYPQSKVADEAQFRVGNILAEKMEKKKEAAEEYGKLEKDFPKSRFAGAAGSQRKKLSAEGAKDAGDKYKDDYYGGVREVDPAERIADELNSPLMQRLRTQRVDLVHEDIDAEIGPADHTLSATVHMTVVAVAPTTDSLLLQLGAPLQLKRLERDGAPAKFSRQENYALVDLGTETLAAGTTHTVDLAYDGKNIDNWSGDIITSASTYLVSRNWIPILNLGDNFTAEIGVTVPENYTAISQGRQIGTEARGGGRTFRYSQTIPVFFYGVTAAPYEIREADYKGRVKIQVCLFPKHADYFDAYLKEIPPALEFLESKLGDFPYPKLAIAEVNFFPGGLGTPGMIIIGEQAFGKKGAPAEFLAHEMAHTWFGNELTLNLTAESFPWLTEGFAQYWDALYHEKAQGHAAFVRHMRTLAENYYTAVSAVQDKPIRGTLLGDPMYYSLSYNKGAFVLHALRGLLGDEKFFAMTKRYVDENRGRIVTIDDFQHAAETAYGGTLDWFFTEWLDRTGIPRYRINGATAQADSVPGKNRTQIEIEQVGDSYRLPVDLEIAGAAGSERKRILVSDQFTTTTIESGIAPERIMIDPDYWILKHPRTSEWETTVTAAELRATP